MSFLVKYIGSITTFNAISFLIIFTQVVKALAIKILLQHDRTHADLLDEMKARLIGWNDATSDMFQWKWVRWNFPNPVSPYQ